MIFCFSSQIVLADGCSSVSFTATATPNLLCSVDFLGLSVQNTDCDYSQPYEYYWDFGDGSPIVYSTINTSHQYQSSGTYNVTLTWEGICHGTPTICFTTQPVQINLPPPPPITSVVSDYNGFNISCFGENDGWISLNSLGSYTYEWQTSPVQYGSTISNLYAGPIDVVAIINGCPSQSMPFDLTQPTQITSNITVDACWSYYTNETNYENSGVYSFATPNNLGCDSTTILTLNVFDDAIFVPNTFTPNKTDNINDRFFIHNNLTEFKMWIYNRWGEEIFYTEDGQLGWDGKYKGKICQDGLYVWMIEFVCGEESKIETGHIFLLK